ncbi:uracil-DNA glycosylase [Desulfosoma sp.]
MTRNGSENTAWRELVENLHAVLSQLRLWGLRDIHRPALPETRDAEPPSFSSEAASAPQLSPDTSSLPSEAEAQHQRPHESRFSHHTPSPASEAAESLGRQATASPAHLLEIIRGDLGDCRRCPLHRNRTHIVFGEGNPSARLVFVGEGPGAEEDRLGRPFVGQAGQLLNKMIRAIGLHRDDVYIANVVKCRPPGNRVPEPDEIRACSPFLLRQLEAIRPRVICTLGACASQTLLQTTLPIGELRRKIHLWRGIPLIATYHPAYLLRNSAKKAETWKDLLDVMAVLHS